LLGIQDFVLRLYHNFAPSFGTFIFAFYILKGFVPAVPRMLDEIGI
jgi:hypothetical protein